MDTGYEPIIEDFSPGKLTDPDTTWSLTETLTCLAAILSMYLILVLKILPAYMKNRPPYKLKHLLSVYNALQVAYSIYLVLIYARYIFRHGIITTRCPKGEDLEGLCEGNPGSVILKPYFITTRSHIALFLSLIPEVISEIYPYFIAKHLDLLDTVFFVLRKKDNQISFLHLYHHTAMLSWTWLHFMYHPTDHFVVVGLLNSFVHVLMYAYYGISSMGPEYAKYVWWKKHLTKVQLVQFILVVSHLHYQQKLSSCQIPSFFHYFCMTSICSFFFLFLQFYFRSYRQRRNKKDLEVEGKESLNLDNSDSVKIH